MVTAINKTTKQMSSSEDGDSRVNSKMLLGIDNNQQFVVCAKNKDILVYSLESKQFFDSLTLDEDVLDISVSDTVCVITNTQVHEVKINPLTLVTTTPFSSLLPPKLSKKHTFSHVKIDSPSKRVFAVAKDNNVLYVTEEKRVAIKLFHLAFHNQMPLFTFNQNHFAYMTMENCLIAVKNFSKNNKVYHRFPQSRRITTILSHPETNSLALADSTGRIFICEINDGHIVPRLIHWHSLSQVCLQWSPDGQHLFSGGQEAALIKWNYINLNREAIAPRLGATISSMTVGPKSVCVLLADQTIHCFSHQLQINSTLCLFLASDGGKSGVFWHDSTGTVAYRRGRDSIHFHDPRAKRDVLSLQIGSENRITGERLTQEEQDKERAKDEEFLFSLSSNGNWMATASGVSTYDVKIWRLSAVGNLEFKLSGHLHKCHDQRILQLAIHEDKVNDEVTLITCSQDGCVRIWIQIDEDQWALKENIRYRNRKPKCFGASEDFSVVAIGYEGIVTLWSIQDDIELKCTLSLNTNQIPNSIVFPQIFNQHLLFCSTQSSVSVWSLLSLESLYKYELPNSKLRCLNGQMTILSEGNAYVVDKEMKLEKATFSATNVSEVVSDTKGNTFTITQSGQCVSTTGHDPVKGDSVPKGKGLPTSLPVNSNSDFNQRLTQTDTIPEVDLIKPLSAGLSNLLRNFV